MHIEGIRFNFSEIKETFKTVYVLNNMFLDQILLLNLIICWIICYIKLKVICAKDTFKSITIINHVYIMKRRPSNRYSNNLTHWSIFYFGLFQIMSKIIWICIYVCKLHGSLFQTFRFKRQLVCKFRRFESFNSFSDYFMTFVYFLCRTCWYTFTSKI